MVYIIGLKHINKETQLLNKRLGIFIALKCIPNNLIGQKAMVWLPLAKAICWGIARKGILNNWG